MRQARRLAARRGCSLRFMFADEARFGRMNRPRPCWAPRATRPQVASQLIREYVYLYRFHSYLNRFESLESLEFSVFFCGALDRNMIRFAI